MNTLWSQLVHPTSFPIPQGAKELLTAPTKNWPRRIEIEPLSQAASDITA